MFILAEETTFTHPVKVRVPVDGGKFDIHSFDCTFKVINQEETRQILESATRDKIHPDEALMKEVVTGWGQVQDVDKNDLSFNEENFTKLVKIPYVRTAMASAFFKALDGVETKN